MFNKDFSFFSFQFFLNIKSLIEDLFVIIHFEQQQHHNNTQTNIYAAVIRSVDDDVCMLSRK
jgi:hypothetical protein